MAVSLWNISGGILIVVCWIVWYRKQQQQPQAPPPKEKFDLDNLAPYPATKIKGKSKYRITMNLKALDKVNWLTVDKNYKQQHNIRTEFLHKDRSMMVQCLPQADEACAEALEKITSFLCERYPAMFNMERSNSGLIIQNKETGETFSTGKDNGMSPLEIASRLTMEDLTILLKNENGEHYIGATASLFPIGWSADQKVGDTVSQMHDPVPHWHDHVGNVVNKFLTRLTPENPMERASYFVQVTEPGESLSSILFQPDGVVHCNQNPRPEDIVVRRERQTFVSLPNSGGIVFGVKTSLTPLLELPLDELENLVVEMQSWPDDTALYKGREQWGSIIEELCRQRQKENIRETGTL